MPRPGPESPRVPAGRSLPDQLRDAILDSGLSAAALARAAGVDTAQVLRFLAEARDVRLETAGRIAGALGLQLTSAPRAKGRPRKEPKP